MKKNLDSIKRVIYQINGILTAQQKRKAVIVCISMILMSFLELLGVGVVYPFLEMLLNIDQAKEKWYVALVFLFIPEISTEGIIVLFSIIIIIVFIFKNIVAIYLSYLQYRFSYRFYVESSSMMLESYLKRPYEFFVNNNSAEILRGINNDTSSVYNELLALFQAIGEMLTIILLGIYLIVTSWQIALAAIVLAGVCFFIIVFGFKNITKREAKIYRQTAAEMNKYSLQAIYGAKEVYVTDKREAFIDLYANAATKYGKTALRYSMIGAVPDRFIEGICMSGFMLIVCAKSISGIDIESFIPVLGAFAMGAFRILPSISKLSGRVNTIVYNQFGLQSCYDNIMEARRLDSERAEREHTYSDLINDVRFEDKIVINDISWRYQNSDRDILDGASLIINKGESVAFVGTSGAGKTTLADIILGLLQPQKGSVKMDGIDIFAIPHKWSKIIGYVPQYVYLVDDTIRENIAFGVEKDKISDDNIWEALRQAQLADFVESLPNGIDTIVGERGIKFSGGQRQRIAIARALYDNPDILVLDEATSALDTETETAVMESIDALHGMKTLIIIAHRLSTIQNCDRVFEVSEGKVREKTGL